MDSTVEYYTLYNETEICSYPFPFPDALLRVISNLKNGAPSCMPLGWWLIVWLQSYASWSPTLLGSVPWCFSAVCGSWHMTLQTLFPFKHTHIITSLTISCASCFLLCRKFNLRFFLVGGGLTTLGVGPVSCISITKNPTLVSHCLSWCLHWRLSTQTIESN